MISLCKFRDLCCSQLPRALNILGFCRQLKDKDRYSPFCSHNFCHIQDILMKITPFPCHFHGFCHNGKNRSTLELDIDIDSSLYESDIVFLHNVHSVVIEQNIHLMFITIIKQNIVNKTVIKIIAFH